MSKAASTTFLLHCTKIKGNRAAHKPARQALRHYIQSQTPSGAKLAQRHHYVRLVCDNIALPQELQPPFADYAENCHRSKIAACITSGVLRPKRMPTLHPSKVEFRLRTLAPRARDSRALPQQVPTLPSSKRQSRRRWRTPCASDLGSQAQTSILYRINVDNEPCCRLKQSIKSILMYVEKYQHCCLLYSIV